MVIPASHPWTACFSQVIELNQGEPLLTRDRQSLSLQTKHRILLNHNCGDTS